MILFAIFKNRFHKGNLRALNGNEAIKKYIIASDLSEFTNDLNFLSQYRYEIAIDGLHYNEF